MPTPHEQFESLDPGGDVQQSRLARLTLAFMTGDALQSASVYSEVLADDRGYMIASMDLTNALVAGLVESWTRNVEPEAVIGLVREQLAALVLAGDSND